MAQEISRIEYQHAMKHTDIVYRGMDAKVTVAQFVGEEEEEDGEKLAPVCFHNLISYVHEKKKKGRDKSTRALLHQLCLETFYLEFAANCNSLMAIAYALEQFTEATSAGPVKSMCQELVECIPFVGEIHPRVVEILATPKTDLPEVLHAAFADFKELIRRRELLLAKMVAHCGSSKEKEEKVKEKKDVLAIHFTEGGFPDAEARSLAEALRNAPSKLVERDGVAGMKTFLTSSAVSSFLHPGKVPRVLKLLQSAPVLLKFRDEPNEEEVRGDDGKNHILGKARHQIPYGDPGKKFVGGLHLLKGTLAPGLITIMPYNGIYHESMSDVCKECCICLTPYVKGETEVVTLQCQHMLDRQCFFNMLDKDVACPICRYDVGRTMPGRSLRNRTPIPTSLQGTDSWSDYEDDDD